MMKTLVSISDSGSHKLRLLTSLQLFFSLRCRAAGVFTSPVCTVSKLYVHVVDGAAAAAAAAGLSRQQQK